jgi:hypothetical protein
LVPRRGRFRDGIAGRHRVEGGDINRWGWEEWIGTLVRNPKRARGIVGNTPRAMQLWVGDGGEPRDIRNEICLNEVGLGAPRTREKSAEGDGCGHQGKPS